MIQPSGMQGLICTHLNLDGEYNLIAQQPLHSFNVKNFVMTPTVTVALGLGDNAVRIIGKFVTSFHKPQYAPRPNSRVVNIKGSLVQKLR